MIHSPSKATRIAKQALAAAISAGLFSAKRMTATLGADGSATLTFTPAYVTPPTVVPVSRFVGSRGYFAVPGVVTTSSVVLTGRRNKGTLLLSDGPNETATSGDTVEVMVLGRTVS